MATNTLSVVRTDARVIMANEAERGYIERFLRMSLFIGMCVLVIFGPLALGVVQYWSVAAFELGASLLLLIWLANQWGRRELNLHPSPLFSPAIAFAALIAFQIALHQTAYRYASLSEAWLYIAYGILLFVAVQLFQPVRIAQFTNVLALFGSVYAFFSIVQGFTSDGRIFWVIKPRAGSVYGSYVNHNHYAGMIELLFPFVLGLAFDSSLHTAKRVVLTFTSALMVTSVFLSGSRGGLLALLVELAFIAVLWMRQNRRKPVALAGVSLTLLTVGLLAAMAPPVATNHMLSLRDASRLLIYRDSINMFLAHPLLGSGLGTFSAVFPHYRVFYDGFITNHAHNDYLEQLLDTGLVGLAIAAWFVVELFRHGLRNVFGRQSTPSARISTAALVACTGFLFHSFTDFNLHIPANAALFYVICAIAAAPALNGPIARKTQSLRANTKKASGEERFFASWSREQGTLQVKRIA